MGIYGVMSYIVTQRTREIGIRMALGALASTILWSVLRRAGSQVGVGLILGFAMSWFLATSIETFLFNVEPRDFRLYAGVCAVLASAALAAAYLPARRAARVDPLVALRTDRPAGNRTWDAGPLHIVRHAIRRPPRARVLDARRRLNRARNQCQD
jgi:ABC-type antimicrobial peptide transport system permease subunit